MAVGGRRNQQGGDHVTIKQGVVTVSTKAELEKVERERSRLLRMMQSRTDNADHVTTLMPNLKERFKTLVRNLSNIPRQQVDKARDVLKSLLGATITLHPCADGEVRYLSAEVMGDYEGLLRLATGQNKFGGGHPIQPSLTDALFIDIQGVARVA